MDEVNQWTTEERLESLQRQVNSIVKILEHYEKMHENAVVVGKMHNAVIQMIVNEIGIGDKVVIEDVAASVDDDEGTNGESKDDPS